MQDNRIEGYRNIYQYNKRVISKIKSINNSKKISKENKDHIIGYIEDLAANGMTDVRQLFYLGHLSSLAELVNKDFNKCDKEDIKKLMINVNKSGVSQWTIQGRVISLKLLFKWMKKIDGKGLYPIEVSWITTGRPENKKETTSKDMFLKEEVEKIISQADNIRDKAIICCLFYGGFRVGELVSLKIRDCEFDDENYMVSFYVYGKTKGRTVHTKEPYYLLKSYLELHPLKENQDAPLWINSSKDTSKANKDNLWDYSISIRRVEKISEELVKKAGIEKYHNPHNYRKSRATYLAPKMQPQVFNTFFGWTGSNMWSVYVKLSEDVLKKELNKFYGGKNIEDLPELIDCNNCGLSNRSTLQSCERCQEPMTKEAIKEGLNSRSGKRNMNIILNKMFETPEFKKAMARLLLDGGFLKYVERMAKHEKEILGKQ